MFPSRILNSEACGPWLLPRNALVGPSAGIGEEILAGRPRLCRHKPARRQVLRGLLAWALSERQMATKRFLPAFLDPAITDSSRRSSPSPTKTSLWLHLSASKSAQAVWVAAGCANIRRGRFGSARSLHGGAASVCARLGREDRGGGREKGSQLLAPEWLFLARLSDCYRCAHSWVSQ